MKQKYLVPPGTGSPLSVDKALYGETILSVSFMVAVVQSISRVDLQLGVYLDS